MALPKNILYPFDFSDRCRASSPAVGGMARMLSVPVTILHALDVDHLNKRISPAELSAIREDVSEKLDNFVTTELKLPNIQCRIAEGDAAECIVENASAMESPLIMMPTRGHTRFRQLLLGSVTAAVLHDAVCPVWTEAHTETQTASKVYSAIVCAIELGFRTADVLQAACEFSAKFYARLHIVHSVSRGDPRFRSDLADRAHSLLVDILDGLCVLVKHLGNTGMAGLRDEVLSLEEV